MKTFALVVLCVTLVAAGPCIQPSSFTNGWVVDGEPDPEFVVRFTVALRHRNVDLMEKELMAVSDPRSPRYGQHYSLEQVTKLFGPLERDSKKAVEWLETYAQGSVDISKGRDHARVHMKVADAEQLFQIKLKRFTHPLSSSPILRSVTEFCVPKNLANIVHVLSLFFNFLDFFISSFNPTFTSSSMVSSTFLTHVFPKDLL
jgi:tripeptidyl-peptidase I